MKNHKQLDVLVTEIQKGDIIKAKGMDAGDGKGINFKSVREPIYVTTVPRLRVTRGREFLGYSQLGDGNYTEVGSPLGTRYRVSRERTDAEIAEQQAEMATFAVDQIRQRIADPMAPLMKARDTFVDMLMKSYATDPARAIHWGADDLAQAQATAVCWTTVYRYATHLANEERPDGAPKVDITDAQILRSVCATVEDVRQELLSGDYSRSTNPYSNAIDDDMRKAKGAWLRDHIVLAALRSAANLGITAE